jgi:hypothetical protein
VNEPEGTCEARYYTACVVILGSGASNVGVGLGQIPPLSFHIIETNIQLGKRPPGIPVTRSTERKEVTLTCKELTGSCKILWWIHRWSSMKGLFFATRLPHRCPLVPIPPPPPPFLSTFDSH